MKLATPEITLGRSIDSLWVCLPRRHNGESLAAQGGNRMNGFHKNHAALCNRKLVETAMSGAGGFSGAPRKILKGLGDK
jgi:hypothetical protein